MTSLSLNGITKSLGGNAILKGIDLEIASGAFVVLVGPSGCGKSTLLRVISGLEKPDAGKITIDGRDVTMSEPRERNIGMVFQSYALYPHLTVRENIAFGLKLRKEPAQVVNTRVAAAAEMLALEGLLERFPKQLSGGQRQRVAMARAIAKEPSLFLFDEPLSNLDAALRNEVRVEIKRLHQRLGTTMVYVTHDQTEAMTLADVLVVLRAGVVEQIGAPLEVFARPASKFVATFLGAPAMNLFDAEVSDGVCRGHGFQLEAPGLTQKHVTVGVRPHDLHESSGGQFEVVAEFVEHLGAESFVHGGVGGMRCIARVETGRVIKAGEVLRFAVREGATHLFEPDSGRRIAT